MYKVGRETRTNLSYVLLTDNMKDSIVTAYFKLPLKCDFGITVVSFQADQFCKVFGAKSIHCRLQDNCGHFADLL